VLHFVSAQRSVKLKGHSFREFQKLVIPLLNGQHSFEDIQERVEHIFRREDLTEGLQLLATYNLLEEGDSVLRADVERRLAPQLNFFHEISGQSEAMQERLSSATVAIVGLGGAGAATALSLAAAGVGTLRCVDASPVEEADVYLSPTFRMKDVGRRRAAIVAHLIEQCAPEVRASVHDSPVESEEEVRAIIDGASFVACCLDSGQSNLIFKLNRTCLKAEIPWTSCTLSGMEVIVGPTVHPHSSACYLCYRMRAVACSANPQDAFAYERYLDRRKQDDSGRHENLVFGIGIAANLLGLEALKELTGVTEPAAVGKIIVFNLLDLTSSKHVILRKPWCPVCFARQREE
jgi:molybdopterin-synthase adenylyltransferase